MIDLPDPTTVDFLSGSYPTVSAGVHALYGKENSFIYVGVAGTGLTKSVVEKRIPIENGRG